MWVPQRRVPPGPHPGTPHLSAPDGSPWAALFLPPWSGEGRAPDRPPCARLSGGANEARGSSRAPKLLLLLERGVCKTGQIKMSSIILFDRMIPYDEVSAPKGVKTVNS